MAYGPLHSACIVLLGILSKQVLAQDIYSGPSVSDYLDVSDLSQIPPTRTVHLYECGDSHRWVRENPKQYQVYHNDRWWTQSCPDDLIWNQDKCRCYHGDGSEATITCKDYRISSNGIAGKYEQFVNGQWIVRDCSLGVAGLVWDQTACQCVWGPDSTGKVVGQEIRPCDLMLNMTFENGVKDDAKGSFVEVGRGIPLPIEVADRRDTSSNHAGYFSHTALNMWFFANNELGSSLRVELKFKMDNDPSTRDTYQILMSNGCNVSLPGYTTPSVAIGYRPSDQSYLLAFETASARKAIVCSQKLGAYDWHTISLIYEDGTLLMRVDGRPCIISQDFTGQVQKTACPLTIGADPLERETMYKGYLDDIIIARYCRRFVDKNSGDYPEDFIDVSDTSVNSHQGLGLMPVEAASRTVYSGDKMQTRHSSRGSKVQRRMKLAEYVGEEGQEGGDDMSEDEGDNVNDNYGYKEKHKRSQEKDYDSHDDYDGEEHDEDDDYDDDDDGNDDDDDDDDEMDQDASYEKEKDEYDGREISNSHGKDNARIEYKKSNDKIQNIDKTNDYDDYEDNSGMHKDQVRQHNSLKRGQAKLPGGGSKWWQNNEDGWKTKGQSNEKAGERGADHGERSMGKQSNDKGYTSGSHESNTWDENHYGTNDQEERIGRRQGQTRSRSTKGDSGHEKKVEGGRDYYMDYGGRVPDARDSRMRGLGKRVGEKGEGTNYEQTRNKGQYYQDYSYYDKESNVDDNEDLGDNGKGNFKRNYKGENGRWVGQKGDYTDSSDKGGGYRTFKGNKRGRDHGDDYSGRSEDGGGSVVTLRRQRESDDLIEYEYIDYNPNDGRYEEGFDKGGRGRRQKVVRRGGKNGGGYDRMGESSDRHSKWQTREFVTQGRDKNFQNSGRRERYDSDEMDYDNNNNNNNNNRGREMVNRKWKGDNSRHGERDGYRQKVTRTRQSHYDDDKGGRTMQRSRNRLGSDRMRDADSGLMDLVKGKPVQNDGQGPERLPYDGKTYEHSYNDNQWLSRYDDDGMAGNPMRKGHNSYGRGRGQGKRVMQTDMD